MTPNPNPKPMDDSKRGHRPRVNPNEETVRKTIRLPESLAEIWDKLGPNRVREIIARYGKQLLKH